MAQRKSIIATEEAAPGSPLRRSSRIATSSPAPAAVAAPSAVSRRRSSANVETTTTPAKIVRAKRLSLSQEVSAPQATPKRTSKTKSPTPQPEDAAKAVGTPARRGRRSSVAKIIEEEPEVASSPSVVGRRRSVRAQTASPDKVEPAKPRGRRVSMTEKVTPMDAIVETESKSKTEPKKPIKRTRRGSVDTIPEAENEEVKTNKNLASLGMESKGTPKKSIRATSKSPIIEEQDEPLVKKKVKTQELNPIVETSFVEEEDDKTPIDQKSLKTGTELIESAVEGKSLKESKSSVTEIKTTIKETISDVKESESPIKEEIKAQVKEKESPIKATKLHMKEIPSQVKVTESPMKTEKSEEKGNKSTVTPLKETKSAVKETQSPMKDTILSKTPAKDIKSQIKESPLKEVTKLSTKEAESPQVVEGELEASNSSIRHSKRLSKTPQKDVSKEIVSSPKNSSKATSPDKLVVKSSTDKDEIAKASDELVEGKLEAPTSVHRHSPRHSKTPQKDVMIEAKPSPKNTSQSIVEDLPSSTVSPHRSSPRLSSLSPSQADNKVTPEPSIEADEPLSKVIHVGDDEIAIDAKSLHEENASPAKPKQDETKTTRRSTRLSKSFSEETVDIQPTDNFKSPKPLTPLKRQADNLLVNELEMTIGSDGSFHLNLSIPNSTNSAQSADEKNKTVSEVLNTSGGSDGSDKENFSSTAQNSPNKSLQECNLTEIIVNTLNKGTAVAQLKECNSSSTPIIETNKSFFEEMEVNYASDVEDSVLADTNKSVSGRKSTRKSLNITFDADNQPAQEEKQSDECEKLMDSFVDELNDGSDELDLQNEGNSKVDLKKRRSNVQQQDDLNVSIKKDEDSKKRRSKVQAEVDILDDEDSNLKVDIKKRKSNVKDDLNVSKKSDEKNKKRKSKLLDDVDNIVDDPDNQKVVMNISDDEDGSDNKNDSKLQEVSSKSPINFSDDESDKKKATKLNTYEDISDDDVSDKKELLEKSKNQDISDKENSDNEAEQDDKIIIESDSNDSSIELVSPKSTEEQSVQYVSTTSPKKNIDVAKIIDSDSIEVINDEEKLTVNHKKKRTSFRKSIGVDSDDDCIIDDRKSRRSKVHDNESINEDRNKRRSKVSDTIEDDESSNEDTRKRGSKVRNESPESALDKLISKKLDEYVSSDDDDEEYKPTHEFLDDEAFEGEEDTPSEGSNDIIDEGESLHSSDTDLDEDEDDYENDSFVVDDESDELLSGNEYDLGDEKKLKTKKKKKSRIIQVSDSEDEIEESIVLDGDEEQPKSKEKKRSRIIQVSDSEDEIKSIELDDDEEEIPGSKINIIQDIKIAPTSGKIVINNEDNLESLEVIKQANPEDIPEEIVIKDKRRQSLIVAETPNNSFTDVNSPSSRKSKRKTSISIQESIKVSEMADNEITDKITKAVDFFCASIKEKHGNVSLNVSLDYANHSNSSDDGVKGKKKLRRLSNDTFVQKVRPSLTVENLEIDLDANKDDFVEEVVSKKPAKRSKRQKLDPALENEDFAPRMLKRISNNFYEENDADSPKKSTKRRSSVMMFDVDVKSTPGKSDVNVELKSKRKSAQFEVAQSSPARVSKDTPIKPEIKNKRKSAQFHVVDLESAESPILENKKKNRKSVQLEEADCSTISMKNSPEKLDVSIKNKRKSGLQNASLIVEEVKSSPKQLDTSLKKKKRQSKQLENDVSVSTDDNQEADSSIISMKNSPEKLNVSLKKKRKSGLQNASLIVEQVVSSPKQLDTSLKKKRQSKQLETDVSVSTDDSPEYLITNLKNEQKIDLSPTCDDVESSPKKLSPKKKRKSGQFNIEEDCLEYISPTKLDTSKESKQTSPPDNFEAEKMDVSLTKNKSKSLTDSLIIEEASPKKMDSSMKKKKKAAKLEIVGTAINLDVDDDDIMETSVDKKKKSKAKKRAHADIPTEVKSKKLKLKDSETSGKTKKIKNKLLPSTNISYLPPNILSEVSDTPIASTSQVKQAAKLKVKKVKVAVSTKSSSSNPWAVEEVVAIKPSKRNFVIKESVTKQVDAIKNKFAANDFRNRMIYDSARNKRSDNKKSTKTMKY